MESIEKNVTTAKSGTERSRKHEEENPGSANHRKYIQRYNEDKIRFHIRRKLLPPHSDLPEWIDTDSTIFKRVMADYEKKMKEQCEVEVS